MKTLICLLFLLPFSAMGSNLVCKCETKNQVLVITGKKAILTGSSIIDIPVPWKVQYKEKFGVKSWVIFQDGKKLTITKKENIFELKKVSVGGHEMIYPLTCRESSSST